MVVLLILLVLFAIGLLGERRLHRLIRERPPQPPSRREPPGDSPYRKLYRPADEVPEDPPDQPRAGN